MNAASDGSGTRGSLIGKSSRPEGAVPLPASGRALLSSRAPAGSQCSRRQRGSTTRLCDPDELPIEHGDQLTRAAPVQSRSRRASRNAPARPTRGAGGVMSAFFVLMIADCCVLVIGDRVRRPPTLARPAAVTDRIDCYIPRQHSVARRGAGEDGWNCPIVGRQNMRRVRRYRFAGDFCPPRTTAQMLLLCGP